MKAKIFRALCSMKAKIFLAFCSILLGLVLLEVCVRIFEPVGSVQAPQFTMDERIGWVRAPNQGGSVYQQNPGIFKTKFRTNSRGMRDREYLPGKGKKLRILILGDSYTEGWGVEEQQAYPEVLEDKFLQEVEVLNFGVVGYSTDMELQQLRQFIKEYCPDFVVLGFYENDIADNTRSKSLWHPRFCKPLFTIQENELELTNAEDLTRQKTAAESKANPIVQWKKAALKRFALLRLIRFSIGKIRYTVTTHDGMELQREVWIRYNPYRLVETEEMKKAWFITERLLVEISNLCTRYGTRFLLTYIPRPLEIVPGILKLQQQNLSVDEPVSTFDLSKPEKKLIEIAQRNGFPFVEIGNYFRKTTQPEKLYLQFRDGHLSVRGQFLVAFLLAKYFYQEGLLPAENFSTELFKTDYIQ